jgi:CheY-like chemotaxis protein
MKNKGYFETTYVEMITNIPGKELKEMIDTGAVKGYTANGKHYIYGASLVSLLKERGKFVPDVFKTENTSVLIVDDDPLVVSSLKRLVEVLDDTMVTTAANAFEMGKAINFRLPDVIILDLNMPGINGLEVLEMLKKAKDTNEVKVVIYSGYITDESRLAIKMLEADAIVTKSSDNRQLLSEIKRLLGLK